MRSPMETLKRTPPYTHAHTQSPSLATYADILNFYEYSKITFWRNKSSAYEIILKRDTTVVKSNENLLQYRSSFHFTNNESPLTFLFHSFSCFCCGFAVSFFIFHILFIQWLYHRSQRIQNINVIFCVVRKKKTSKFESTFLRIRIYIPDTFS